MQEVVIVSGVRIPVTLFYQMRKIDAKLGVASLGIGGGQVHAFMVRR